jgi:hypothetical protein
MARLLLFACLALAGSACLIPQDDAVFPDLPPRKNSPLRVLAPSVKPEQRKTTIRVGPVSETCPRPEFSMTVADEDTGDQIRSLWFVDPTPTYQPTPTNPVPVFNGGVIFGGTSVTRQVSAPNAMLTFLTGLVDGREHLVEAWVTDGEFDPNGPPTSVSRPDRTLPDGSTVPDTAYTDSNVWIVRVEDCQR